MIGFILFAFLFLGSSLAPDRTSSDPSQTTESAPASATDSESNGAKTIITLSVVFGVCGIVLVVLLVLCCCNREPIVNTAPDPRNRAALDAFWRTYTDTEDLSAASAWSDPTRSTISIAGTADAICPICHARHAQAVDLGLPRDKQDLCRKLMEPAEK
jgi:hypothetical protein